jgi:hypothetical protein
MLDSCPAETVSVDVAMAFGCGEMGLGRLKLTPLGAVVCQDGDNVTGSLKPSCESTVIIEDPVVP